MLNITARPSQPSFGSIGLTIGSRTESEPLRKDLKVFEELKKHFPSGTEVIDRTEYCLGKDSGYLRELQIEGTSQAAENKIFKALKAAGFERYTDWLEQAPFDTETPERIKKGLDILGSKIDEIKKACKKL